MTIAKAPLNRINNKKKASTKLTSPEVTGRNFVRATCLSTFRSAISLKTQPAARIKIVPMQNDKNSFNEGTPRLAIHKAHAVGHQSKSVPAGLSNRNNLQ